MRNAAACLIMAVVLILICAPQTGLGPVTPAFTGVPSGIAQEAGKSLESKADRSTSDTEAYGNTIPKFEADAKPVTPLYSVPAIPLVEYSGPLYHVFFHFLIAFPDVAYTGRYKGALDRDCITPNEFRRSLEEMYDNDFILVDINSTFEEIEENGKKTVKRRKLMLPEGKKPLVMSIDDICYDPDKLAWGMVHRVMLDYEGNFATYTRLEDGTEIVSHDNEVIPILEKFVMQHPDFSFNNAKATLAVTGWEGILGYRISPKYPEREQEIEKLRPLVGKLKEKGWNFASHGYGHRHSDQISYSLFADDTRKWNEYIGSIVGPTAVYVYPYGEKLDTDDPKYKLLLDYGFKVMCGVGMSPYWKEYGDSVLMSRQCVDGFTLRSQKELLKPLLDADKVIELEVRELLNK